MIESLISSKTRIKLLLKFFLNSEVRSYLRQLEGEFGESSNAVRVELNRLEKAGLLNSYSEGNKRFFRANKQHPLFEDIHNIVRKYIGIDKIILEVIKKLGDVEEVYLTGDFAKGRNSPVIDIIIIGDIDKAYLTQLIEKAENLINRKIKYLNYSSSEQGLFEVHHNKETALLLWRK